MTKTNPHQILGTNENSTPEEIKKAYRKLSLENHPDHGGNQEKFKQINEAYEELLGERKQEDGSLETFMQIMMEAFTCSDTPVMEARKGIHEGIEQITDQLAHNYNEIAKFKRRREKFLKENKKETIQRELVENALNSKIGRLENLTPQMKEKLEELKKVQAMILSLDESSLADKWANGFSKHGFTDKQAQRAGDVIYSRIEQFDRKVNE